MDLGPPRTLPEMRDLLGDMLRRYETADGAAPKEAWLMVDTADFLTLRRLHGVLVGLAPHQERVRAILTGKRFP